MAFYERGPVRIHYEEVGSGFPLLLIPGGGLNSSFQSWKTASPFNPMERYAADFRCVCADLRNANPGQSTGPLEIDRPWDAYTDDQLGLMDHLGIREFLVMGFCIGGPMIHNLIKRAPERIVAAAMMQPSGFRPEVPDLFYQNNIKGWGPPLCEKRSDVTMDMVHAFLTSMYTNRADFVFTVSRDFVRTIRQPLLIAPDDVPAHPVQGGDGGGEPRPELRGDHLSLEGHARAHRPGRGPRAPLPEVARARRRRPVGRVSVSGSGAGPAAPRRGRPAPHSTKR